MAANDAFTAGVRPGGLTNSTEIRLLLCYLVKNAGPITRTEIENALMEEALVNYFEIGSCLDDITRQSLVTLQNDRYAITEERPQGRRQELAYDLPRSVREPGRGAVFLGPRPWARKEAWNTVPAFTEKADGHCSVRCTVKALDQELFCLDLGTPDRLSAELVKKQFILKGNEIYQMLITKLTEEKTDLLQFSQRERSPAPAAICGHTGAGAFCLTPNSLVIFSTLAENLNNGQTLWYAY